MPIAEATTRVPPPLPPQGDVLPQVSHNTVVTSFPSHSAGGGSGSDSGAGSNTHLGAADAALALDEELSGAPLRHLSLSDHQGARAPWRPGMGVATVVVLEGATPEFKIRRVCDKYTGHRNPLTSIQHYSIVRTAQR